ncbi:MAG: glycosyltransferase family 2 protein [Actinomycetota bacterium]
MTQGMTQGMTEGSVDLSLIIPCLNEEQNVWMLVQHLDELLDDYGIAAEILIVDDCSDDYTFREAYRLEAKFPRVRALHKGLPRGIGNAIMFGVDHAVGGTGVVVMGDLVDPLEALPDMHRKIREGFHLCLISRYARPEDSRSIPTTYRFYQWCFRRALKWMVGMNVKDSTYAFRAFDLDFIRSLKLNSSGFEISPEMTIKSYLAGGRITNLPGRQGKRLHGESKFAFSREGWGYAKVLFAGLGQRLSRRSQPGSFTPSMSSEPVGGQVEAR